MAFIDSQCLNDWDDFISELHFIDMEIETQSRMKLKHRFPHSHICQIFHVLEPTVLPYLHLFVIPGYISSFDFDWVLTWDAILDSPLTYSCPFNPSLFTVSRFLVVFFLCYVLNLVWHWGLHISMSCYLLTPPPPPQGSEHNKDQKCCRAGLEMPSTCLGLSRWNGDQQGCKLPGCTRP